MKKQVRLVLVAAALAMCVAPAAQAQKTVIDPVKGKIVRTTDKQPCALCFSCGGRWPEFAGSFDSSNPNEFGSQCADPLQVRTDSRPQLCCKRRN